VVTRSPHRADQLAAAGYRPLVADVTQPQSLQRLPAADTLLFAVGYDRQSAADIRQVYAGGLRNVLQAIATAHTAAQRPDRIVYISSTGVYGAASEGWVDEETPPAPTRPGGVASWEAEQVVEQSWAAPRSVILRMAGLYGPGRVPMLESLRRAEPLPTPAQGWLNLIHIDDAASITRRVCQPPFSPAGGSLPERYCVSDGHPVVRGEYYREIARRLDLPPPRFVTPESDTPATQRGRVSRRVRSDRLRKVYCITLKYPSYREGLAAILQDEEGRNAD
jgi:nucleoside-diphosphate-sugar epimerase